jgi:3-oxoacyl-[acyl-carrier protein] reductase
MSNKKTTPERLAAFSDGRRRSFLEKWAPAHNMSVEDATKKFPEEPGSAAMGNQKR